jgi:tetratricopeptide (TPR) repeat protein
VVPIKLSCFYPYPKITDAPLYAYSLYCLCVVGAAAVVLGIWGKHAKRVIFGTLFFFVTLFPVLQLVRFGTLIADRYAYLPSLGLLYLVSMAVRWIYRRLSSHGLCKVGFFVCAIAITGTLTFLTWQRTKIWKDSITLWQDAIHNALPNSKAYNNLCQAYIAIGRNEKAIPACRKAIQLSLRDPLPYYNLGYIYEQIGRKTEAMALYRQAFQLNPLQLAAAKILPRFTPKKGSLIWPPYYGRPYLRSVLIRQWRSIILQSVILSKSNTGGHAATTIRRLHWECR